MTHRCMVSNCGEVTDDLPRYISGCLMSWHVYEQHPEEWVKSVGENRPPRDPDPRTVDGMADAIIMGLLSGM